MTNIKYSKRFKLRNGERVDFCPSMCSVCQTTQEYETKYCPECGAKMDGDNNVK